jgi:hypothetical protein
LYTENSYSYVPIRKGVFMIGFLAVFLCVACFSTMQARSIKRSVMMHVLEEEVNGVVFTYRVDTLDGHHKETWVINGKPVSHEEYTNRILHEEALESQMSREEERRRLCEQQRFIMQEQRSLLKKIVHIECKGIEKYVEKLRDLRLQPYRIFGADSFATQEDFEVFVNKSFPGVQALLVDNESPLFKLQEAFEWLKPYQGRLIILYKATLQAARERSDDTRLLKDLLHVVSEAT